MVSHLVDYVTNISNDYRAEQEQQSLGNPSYEEYLNAAIAGLSLAICGPDLDSMNPSHKNVIYKKIILFV